MALINRVSRLFRADFHAVLDRIEEPESLLRQAIREMEDELNQDEQRYRLLQHEAGQLKSRHHDLEQTLTRLEGELDTCFSADNEELARTLIKRKLEALQAERFIRQRMEGLEQTERALNNQIKERQDQLESMRQKAELLAEGDHQPSRHSAFDTAQFTVDKADVEVAFLQEKKKRSSS